YPDPPMKSKCRHLGRHDACPAASERLPRNHPMPRMQLRMNDDSVIDGMVSADDDRPILIIPYMWIGDFVRGHSVVRVLNQRWPNRPVDLLTTSLCAPLMAHIQGDPANIA